MRLILDFLSFCGELLICLWTPNLIAVAGCVFCCAILLNLDMGNGEPDEPLENGFPTDEAERATTWLGV